MPFPNEALDLDSSANKGGTNGSEIRLRKDGVLGGGARTEGGQRGGGRDGVLGGGARMEGGRQGRRR
jgi:hypothetical protein